MTTSFKIITDPVFYIWFSEMDSDNSSSTKIRNGLTLSDIRQRKAQKQKYRGNQICLRCRILVFIMYSYFWHCYIHYWKCVGLLKIWLVSDNQRSRSWNIFFLSAVFPYFCYATLRQHFWQLNCVLSSLGIYF